MAIKKLAFFRQLALNFVCVVNSFIIFLQFHLKLASLGHLLSKM